MASIPLAVVTAAAEEVGFSIPKDAVEDMEEDVNEVEEDTYKEVVEESVSHMKLLVSELGVVDRRANKEAAN